MARAIDPAQLDPNIRLARNNDNAWLSDLHLIRELTRQEHQAEEDHAFAARLAGVTIDEIPEDRRRMAMLLDDFDDDSEDELPKIGPNNVTAARSVSAVRKTTANPNQSKLVKCVICLDQVTKNDPRTLCGHAYDLKCLKDLFLTAMQDESLMPPRCCKQEIPTALVRLTPDEAARFNAKLLEYSTPNRLYCCQPSCSTFIPPTCITNGIGTCPKRNCRTTTCSICKAASHGHLDCPKDDAMQALLTAADKAGWARCYQCRALVELTQGCYHMTCRCRAEFCYLCVKPWKTCTCAQWDEERLMGEARMIVARTPVRTTRAVDRVNTEQRVERMANQLRANYECRHPRRWICEQGAGRCEECGHFLAMYLFRCPLCDFMACNRCRRNRL